MNNKTKTVLLIISAILVATGIALLIYAAVSSSGNGGGDDTAAETQHAEIEYRYDDEGNISSEIYYKNDKYNGQTDYYLSSDKKTYYAIVYDKDSKEIGSTVTKYNSLGTIVSVQVKELGEVVSLTEYDYYDDLTTPKIKVEKTYEDGVENAVKTYFAEDGQKTRVCEYKDGELVSDTNYDENSIINENGGETVEE